jgi:high-affinity iron transporter
VAPASDKPELTLAQITTMSPGEAAVKFGAKGRDQVIWLRNHPQGFWYANPIDLASSKLDESLTAYRKGMREKAYQLSVSAYLEGFELAETALRNVDPELMSRIERGMTAWRKGIRDGVSVSEAERSMAELDSLFNDARRAMDGVALSGATAFGSAFVILLREGLEAILVIAALAAFLIKTERTDAMRYIHYGWIGALAVGLVTWWLATRLLGVSGEAREMTEAVAALVAAGVLLYVGIWMHSKTNARRWQDFIQQSVNKALNGATLWSLAGLAFITVYREVFETILFYQTLWLQSSTSGTRMVVIGFVAAAGVLALLGWLILRYSPRLPLRQFFMATGSLVFVLALVFTGKGIAALQEAGKIPSTLINIPKIELLGIYPNVEGVGMQLFILLLVLGVLGWQSYQGRRLLMHDAATSAAQERKAARH